MNLSKMILQSHLPLFITKADFVLTKSFSLNSNEKQTVLCSTGYGVSFLLTFYLPLPLLLPLLLKLPLPLPNCDPVLLDLLSLANSPRIALCISISSGM